MIDEAVISFRTGSEDGYEVFFNSTRVGTFLVPDKLKEITVLDFSELESFGDTLGEALFGGSPSLEDLFRGINPPSRIVFEFREGVEDLLGLPWEFVKHPQSSRPISLEMPFVRRIGEGMELEPLQGRPLKVLVVISEPLTQVSFDARRFHDVIVKEAEKLVDEGLLQLEFLSLPSTPDSLARKLLEETPDVIHFIGHGNVGVLLLENEDGSESRVEAEKFHVLFKNGKLRLTILTACYSGAVPGKDLVSGTATALVQAGVPSVVGMQLPILIEAAYQMVGDLYAGFLKEPFDDLVKRLRASRFFAERSRAPSQWGIPVFYLQDKSGHLLKGISKGESFLKVWPSPSSAYLLPEKPELFVGRKDLLVETNRALRQDRVVVLHGLSGMGKSFLARELCHWHRLRGSYHGGIIWLDFQAGGSYATALERVRLGLHITEVSEEAIMNRLGSEPTLIILDSYQNVMDDSELTRFLANLPKITTALLTSTEGVEMGRTVPVWEMKAEDAFEFFWRRAEKVGWDGVGKDYISEICGELGYMPLAIELIAPQAASVPMKDILDKVRKNLSAVAAERSDLPLRHRKVEAALRVSYDPLKPQEKLVLARMSVFPGDAFHEHISKVIEISDVVDILQSLQRRGLVFFERSRYRLHHTVRRFALERLEKTYREREKYEEKFAVTFLGFATWGYEALETEDSRNVMAMTQLELQNFFGAQQWFLEKERLDEFFSLSSILSELLLRCGLWRSKAEVVSLRLRVAEEKGDKTILVSVLESVGTTHFAIGDLNKAREYYERSLKIAEDIGQKQTIVDILQGLGNVAHRQKNWDEARGYYERTLKIARGIGYTKMIAEGLFGLGLVEQMEDNLDKAKGYYEESLKITKDLGTKEFEARILHHLGIVEQLHGHLDKAEEYLKRSLKINELIGYEYNITINLAQLGRVYQKRRDFGTALKYYLSAAYRLHQIGSSLDENIALGHIAKMYKELGKRRFLEILRKMPKEIRNYMESLETQ